MKVDPEIAGALGPWFKPETLDGVRLIKRGPICWFVRSVLRQGAMTISPYIFYGRSSFDPARAASLALLAHELKHIEQYREVGYVRFFIRYFWDKGKNRFQYSRELPLEAEAYALQDEVLSTLRNTMSR
jgi:hypothetical protein